MDASGTAVESYEYDAFGGAIEFKHGTTSITPAQALTVQLFGGDGEYDRPTGLFYHDARWRGGFWFISADDPAYGNSSDPMSLHKYLYANANPIMGSDPSGRATFADMGADSFVMEAEGQYNASVLGFQGLAEAQVGAIQLGAVEEAVAIESLSGASTSEVTAMISRVAANARIGSAFEQAALRAFGSVKNFQSYATFIVRNGLTTLRTVIPDSLTFLGRAAVLEIKNTAYLYLSSQLSGMIELAVARGVPFVLVVAQRTQIAQTLIDAIAATGGQIIRMP